MTSALKTIPAAFVVSLGLAAPANGKERVDTYLVPDATGGAPILLKSVGDWHKEKSVRAAVVKSGVLIAKEQKVPGTRHHQALKGDAVYLRGITDVKGKEVLPRAYRMAVPISSRTALVRRMDEIYGFVDLKTREFRALPPAASFKTFPFGSKAPMRLVLGTRQSDGTYSYCVVGATGNCDAKITKVDGSATSNRLESSIHGFADNFVVRHREGDRTWSASYRWDQTVVASALPPVTVVQRYDRDTNSIRFNSLLFELPLPPRRFGTVLTKLYWPIDDSASPAAMPGDFVGMFPFDPIRTDSKHVEAWEGFVVIRLINGEERYWIGDRIQRGSEVIYTPEVLAKMSHALVGPFTDVWIEGGGIDARGDIPDRFYRLAVRRGGTGNAAQWVSAERLDPTVPLMTRLREAQTSTLTVSDPVLATHLQLGADARRRDAALAAYKAQTDQRGKILSDLRALPQTFVSAPGSCYPFYAHAKTQVGHEPGLFMRAYDANPTEACRLVPESIYASMERAGLIRSGGTASKLPEKTFAEKVADWNRDIESRGKAKELERATTGRTCVTVVHVRYC